MDAQDCINAIEEGMDRITSEESERVVTKKEPLRIGIKDMSEIVGRRLSGFDYRVIAKIILAIRGKGKIFIPRQYRHSELMVTAFMLASVLPLDVIFTDLEIRLED